MSKYVSYFKGKSRAEFVWGWVWFTAIVLVFISWILLMYHQNVFISPIDHPDLYVLKFFAFKSIYLILGISVIAWLNRNYRICRFKHGFYENKVAALATVDKFLEASEDKQYRDTILVECSKLIFCSLDIGGVNSGSNHSVVGDIVTKIVSNQNKGA